MLGQVPPKQHSSATVSFAGAKLIMPANPIQLFQSFEGQFLTHSPEPLLGAVVQLHGTVPLGPLHTLMHFQQLVDPLPSPTILPCEYPAPAATDGSNHPINGPAPPL